MEASVTVKPSYGLTDDEIAGMLRSSIDHATDDMQARALREHQVEAHRLIEATEVALAEDGNLLDAAERGAITGLLDNLRRLAAGRDARSLAAAVAEANRATTEFAARRMNQSVRRAIAGQKLDEIKI